MPQLSEARSSANNLLAIVTALREAHVVLWASVSQDLGSQRINRRRRSVHHACHPVHRIGFVSKVRSDPFLTGVLSDGFCQAMKAVVIREFIREFKKHRNEPCQVEER